MNKCICYSLFDINNINFSNLYYYNGILKSLCTIDRDFDIHIDVSEKCYNILIDIINIENLSLKNVFFYKHNNDECGLMWRFYRCFNLKNYDCIIIQDSDIDKIYGEYFADDLKNGIIFTLGPDNIRNWGKKSFPGGKICIKPKYLLKNIEAYKYIIDKFINIFRDDIYYGIDEFFLEYLFQYEMINNNVLYLSYRNKESEKYIKNFKFIDRKIYNSNKLKFENNNYYLYNHNNVPFKINPKIPKNDLKNKNEILNTKYRFFMDDVLKFLFFNVDNFYNYE